MSRAPCLTQKTPTPLGTLYTHVSYDAARRIRKIALSLPGKHDGNEIDIALDAIVASLNDSIQEIGA